MKRFLTFLLLTCACASAAVITTPPLRVSRELVYQELHYPGYISGGFTGVWSGDGYYLRYSGHIRENSTLILPHQVLEFSYNGESLNPYGSQMVPSGGTGFTTGNEYVFQFAPVTSTTEFFVDGPGQFRVVTISTPIDDTAPVPVPEPSALVLTGCGLLGLSVRSRLARG